MNNKMVTVCAGVLTGILIVLLLPLCASPEQDSSDIQTRAEFVARVSDYFGWPHPSDYNDIWKVPLRKFNDVRTDDEYGKQIETAYEEGIIAADASGNFNPNNAISRQDAAVVLAKAFKLPEASGDSLSKFDDSSSIRSDVRASVNSLVALGYMSGRSSTVFAPNDPLTTSEADAVFNSITSSMVAPVQAVPKTNAVAPRRYVKLWTPTPGATIFFTTDGSTPTVESEIYTVATKGHINEMLSNDQLPERDVVYTAIAMKDGMISSPVQTFTWHLYRPKVAEFQHDLILEKTATRPAVYRIYCDAESVRAMAWYIEGQDAGICFDALQTPADVANLKEYIDKNIATKPNFLVIGHQHGDHSAQAPNFLKAGVDVFANKRGWSAYAGGGGPFPAIFPNPSDQAKIKNVDEGDEFNLGGCDLYVYALPGHADDNIILQDKANGLVFSSDIYGCTRAGSADNVGVTRGIKADLLLSFAQQAYSNYLKDGGKTTMLFTGHDETPLGDNNLKLFEKALQQVIDYGEAGCSPTLRGNNNRPGTRTTLVGDMWRDGTNWIALALSGILGDDTEYLTSSPINYNGNGFMKYSVLSNIEIEGGELVGTTVRWSDPVDFSWAGSRITVPNSLPNKFDPWTYDYTIEVPSNQDSITVIPTSMSTRISMMLLNGMQIDYRSRNEIPVSNGTVFAIRIVAPDTVTSSTYTFTVSKPES